MSSKLTEDQLNEMGSVIDENGEVYLSVDDLVKHFENNIHRMHEVQPEHITAKRFIGLLRQFESGIKEMDS